jgi:hypothetical protein
MDLCVGTQNRDGAIISRRWFDLINYMGKMLVHYMITGLNN